MTRSTSWRAEGVPVIAAAPGRVEKLFFSEGGGGITAYVRSADQRWIYYYAHLQAYAPGLREGQQVQRGADRLRRAIPATPTPPGRTSISRSSG